MPFSSAVEHVMGRVMRLFTHLPLQSLIHLFAQQGLFMDYFKGFETMRLSEQYSGKTLK
jgi:hypothetical protein